ncbi:hypothetical protein EO244_10335 [Ancylomarina salipaludis]|uniref:Uncharacterized protein n=1 Tax=Ancylomarina salipaludis TaxID=2501299 RepID=A0A4Q1JLY9_9BACT|nr:hypothetical protein [Ancylomarina salipaludis]RXQ93965.1 hypothetical protein EO244_10335 [Ancylomarina salipaludis]
MKINKLYSLIVVFALIFVACDDTNKNLVGSRGVAVIPVITDVNPAFYTSDLANSYVQFVVDLPEGMTVDAAEVQVTYKGKNAVVQEITTFPTTVTLEALDVISILGINASDVAIDDSFLFHVVTTSNGASSRSTAALNVFVTCEYDPAMAVGSYHVVSEDWEVVGDVTFTADPDDPYKIFVTGIFEMEGGDANDNKLELNIDPNSFKVGVVTSVLGPTAPWGSYTNYYYGPGGGLFKSCDGSFEMQFKITVDEGSFGTYNFVFTRN